MFKLSPPNAFVAGAFLVFPGFTLGSVASLTTLDCLKIGFFWPLILCLAAGLLAIIPVLFARAVIAWLIRRERWPRWLESKKIIWFASALSLLFVGIGVYSATPRQRYFQIVGTGSDDGVSEIRASGFSSFLATRWLISFKIDSEGVETIRTRWNLQETEPFSLKDRIAPESIFGSSGSAMLPELPQAEGTRCFVTESNPETGPATWVTFVVRESDGRAWFLRGYQN